MNVIYCSRSLRLSCKWIFHFPFIRAGHPYKQPLHLLPHHMFRAGKTATRGVDDRVFDASEALMKLWYFMSKKKNEYPGSVGIWMQREKLHNHRRWSACMLTFFGGGWFQEESSFNVRTSESASLLIVLVQESPKKKGGCEFSLRRHSGFSSSFVSFFSPVTSSLPPTFPIPPFFPTFIFVTTQRNKTC